MANRSNINLVGNTTQGQNLGGGANIFKCKTRGNNLQFKTISATGTSIQIFNRDNQIYISGKTGSNNYVFTNGLCESGGNVCLGGTVVDGTIVGLPSNGALLGFESTGTYLRNIYLQSYNSTYTQGAVIQVMTNGLDASCIGFSAYSGVSAASANLTYTGLQY